MPDPEPMSKIRAGEWVSEKRAAPAQLPKIRASVPTFMPHASSRTTNCLNSWMRRPERPTDHVFGESVSAFLSCHVSNVGKSSMRLSGSAVKASTFFMCWCATPGSAWYKAVPSVL